MLAKWKVPTSVIAMSAGTTLVVKPSNASDTECVREDIEHVGASHGGGSAILV